MDERENLVNSVIDQSAKYKTEKSIIHNYEFSLADKTYIVEQIHYLYPLALRRIAEDKTTDSEILKAIYDTCKEDPNFPIGLVLTHPNCSEDLLLRCIVPNAVETKEDEGNNTGHDINNNIAKNPGATDVVLKKLFSIYFGNHSGSQKVLFTIVNKRNLSDAMFVLLLTSLQSTVARKKLGKPYFYVRSKKDTQTPTNEAVFDPYALLCMLLETIETDDRSELWWFYSDSETRKHLSIADMKISPFVEVEVMLFHKAKLLPWSFNQTSELNNPATLHKALKNYATKHTDYNFDDQDLPVDWMIELLIPYAEERMKGFDNE